MLKIKTKNSIFIFAAVVGLLIFLHFVKVLAPLENAVIFLINPVADKIYSLSSGLQITVNRQADKRDLLATIKNLEARVNQLIVDNSQLRMIEEENKKLRQQLKFFTKTGLDYFLANVVSRGVLNDSLNKEQIIIDKGAKDGLSAGLAVLSGQGIIIGKIVEVKENIARVCLITDKNCKLAVVVQSQDGPIGASSRTSGIIEGDLGLTIKMNFIPQGEKVREGDIVVTSGLEKNIPSGLVIGKIIQVESGNNEIWQKATLEPLVNLEELTIVSVLLPLVK